MPKVAVRESRIIANYATGFDVPCRTPGLAPSNAAASPPSNAAASPPSNKNHPPRQAGHAFDTLFHVEHYAPGLRPSSAR